MFGETLLLVAKEILGVPKQILAASMLGATASGTRNTRTRAARARNTAGGGSKRNYAPVATCRRAHVDVVRVIAEDTPSGHGKEVSNPSQVIAGLLTRR